MKILWLTNTPGKAAQHFGYPEFAGGWISALQELVMKNKELALSICFFYDGRTEKRLKLDGVNYFGIPLRSGDGIRRIFNRQYGILDDENSEAINSVLAICKPDLIHVFGTERGFGKIIPESYNKVLFHIQGILNPYKDAYFASGISPFKSLTGSGLTRCLRGTSFYHQYLELTSRAKREKEIIKRWSYFSGRTEWDKNFINTINPKANYFHCDEMLRTIFFEMKRPKHLDNINGKLEICTTINPNIYKGLDLIYKTIPLIQNIEFSWKIFGISEHDQYNRLIKKYLGIKKTPHQILFMGPTEEKKLATSLNECHLFVHPSYIDNSPNSVCEAMALGLPVAASFVGGIPSLIKHRENGYLFNPSDRYDLAGWIIHIRDNYLEAKNLGNKGRETALKRHDPETIRRDIYNIYKSILEID